MIFNFVKNFTVYHSPKVVRSFVRMSSSAIESIKNVDIDPEGTFKYILIKVYGEKESDTAKCIVRGYKRCAYHSDIYDEVIANEITPRKLESECLGGGRIQHDPQEKKLKIYGYSQGYGKADHSVSVDILKKTYADYSISWSDEGY